MNGLSWLGGTQTEVINKQIADDSPQGGQQADFIQAMITEFEDSAPYKFMEVAQRYYENDPDIRDKKRTVIGKDMVGILAKISIRCAETNANIVDVTQTIMQDLFVMVMIVEIDKLNCEFGDFADSLSAIGSEMGLDIRCMHEDIFNSMHRI